MLLLEIDMSSIVHCWFIIYQMGSYLTGSYMEISNLALIHGLIFFPFCRFIPIMQIRNIWIKVHNSSPQKQLNQITPNFSEKVLVWSSLNIVSNIPTLYSTWRPFKKWIYLSISALLSVKMISYLNSSWITMSCWSYHPNFPVICILFYLQIYTDYVYF